MGKPTLYLDNSVLFPRGKKKSLKPDPQTEDLHPEDDVNKAGSAQQSAGRTVDPPETKHRRSDNNSYKRTLMGISGAATIDDPDVGRDWHNDKSEEDEAEEESEATFPEPSDPFNLEENKKSLEKSLALLRSIPKFKGPYKYTGREVDFLLQKGFTSETIELGNIRITKQLRTDFLDYIKKDMFKSLESIRLCGR